MTEAKRPRVEAEEERVGRVWGEGGKVEAEEERVGRVWGEGAWGDILPSVCHLLPPRDRFLVQRVSKLFQLASESSRLAVKELELNVIQGEAEEVGLEFTAKIDDLLAPIGIRSLTLPQLTKIFDCSCGCAIFENEKILKARREREKKFRKKYYEILAKLSFPNLYCLYVYTGPSLESVLPFLRRHQGISYLALDVPQENCLNPENSQFRSTQLKSICDSLSNAKIKFLAVDFIDHNLDFAKEFEGTSLFSYVNRLTLVQIGIKSNSQLLPKIHPHLTDVCLVDNCQGDRGSVVTDLLQKEVPTLRHLNLGIVTSFHHGDVIAQNMRKMSLESLHFAMLNFEAVREGLKPFLEALVSAGKPSNLTMSLKELGFSIKNTDEFVDFGIFNTTAFLHFPNLDSLYLEFMVWVFTYDDGTSPTIFCRNLVSYEELPVFEELNRRLRVLEIPVLLPEAFESNSADRSEALNKKFRPFLQSARCSDPGQKIERRLMWLPVYERKYPNGGSSDYVMQSSGRLTTELIKSGDGESTNTGFKAAAPEWPP